MTLQQLDPIYVDFYLPQQALAADQGRPGRSPRKVDTYPGTTFAGEIIGDQFAGRYRDAQRPGARHV